MAANVINVFEKIGFPEFGLDGIATKIDTGAYRGAFHCTKIHEEKTENGKLLHFSPFDTPNMTITTDKFTREYVRSSNGSQEKRYFIETTIRIKGKNYLINLSLANRTNMKWPVLIGRTFLRKNNLLVDVGGQVLYGSPRKAKS